MPIANIINPNIALSGQGPDLELADKLRANTLAREAQRQQIDQANALFQLKQQQVALEEQRRNALNSAWSGMVNPETGEVDYAAGRRALVNTPAAGEIANFLDIEAKQRKSAADIGKITIDTFSKAMDESRKRLNIINPDSPDAVNEYLRWSARNLSDSVLGPILKNSGGSMDEAFRRVDEALRTPGGMRQLIAMETLGADAFMKENAAKLSNVDTGGTVRERMLRPITGEVNTVRETKKTMAPGESERIALDRARLGNEQARLGLEERRVKLLEAKDQIGSDVQLSKKDLQAREAAYPKATSSLKAFEADANELITLIEQLKNHPGLSSITGLVAGRTPSITDDGRAAEALFEQIVAKGGLKALQDLRNASPTGAGLGNQSNQEGQRLESSFSGMKRKLSTKDFIKAAEDTIEKLEGSKARLKEAYDLTYEYRAKFLGFE